MNPLDTRAVKAADGPGIQIVSNFTSRGSIFEPCGTNRTSSNVKACLNGERFFNFTPILNVEKYHDINNLN